MADIVLRQDEQLPLATQVRYRDMEDTTHALVGAAEVQTLYERGLQVSNRFKATYVQPHGGELVDDATHDFLIKVGSLASLVLPWILTGGGCEVFLYELPTTTGDGNQLDSISKNREVLGVSTTEVYEGPTVTAPGTLLFHLFVPGLSVLIERLYGGGWRESEWILAPNTNYLVRITNRSGAAIQLSVSLGWSDC